MVARPNGFPVLFADPVPNDMEVLPAVLDVFDNHSLVLVFRVAVFLLKAFDDGQNLFAGKAFVLHRINADMVDVLFCFAAASHFPHFMKRFVQRFGPVV